MAETAPAATPAPQTDPNKQDPKPPNSVAAAPAPTGEGRGAGLPNAEMPGDAPPAKKKVRYKAAGQDYEEEVDDGEIARRFALARGSGEVQRRVADERKKLEAEKEEWKKGGYRAYQKWAKENGVPVDQQTEDWLIERHEQNQMTPEQKRVYELEKFKKDTEERETTAKAQRDQEETNQRRTAASERWTKAVAPVLKGLGYSDDVTGTIVMPMVAQALTEAHEAQTAMSTEQAIADTHERLSSFAGQHLKGLDKGAFVKAIAPILATKLADATGEEIFSLLGEKSVGLLMKHTAKMLRPKAFEAQPGTKQTTQVPSESELRQQMADPTHQIMGRVPFHQASR